MRFGTTVYGPNGKYYFSTEYNPFNYVGYLSGNTAQKQGSKIFQLGSGRGLIAYGVDGGIATQPIYPKPPTGLADISSHVYYWTEENTVYWKYHDFNDPWDRDFEIVLIVFSEDRQ